ncbi:MAG TPA: hypothetical protein VG122_25615 [Gemmata sp.]|nr:hypothetical protein [Gemmata sp.]
MTNVNRRQFLKQAAVTSLGAREILKSSSSLADVSVPPTHPVYIRSNIPAIAYPPHRGSWYDDRVPDTLDLAEMARLLVNGLTGPNDPLADYEQYFGIDFGSNPPRMGHGRGSCQMRSMKALPLMRHISGSDLNHPIDQVWMDVVLKSIGPDGLYYVPTEGRPWAHRDVESNPRIYTAKGTTVSPDEPSVTQYTSSFNPGYAISTMMIYYLRDSNPVWRAQIEGMIDGLAKLVIDKGDYCFLPAAEFEPNAKVPPTATMPIRQLSVESGTWLLDGLGKYYQLPGYPPARELGRKLVNYLRYQGKYFDATGGCFDLAPDLMDMYVEGFPNFMANHFHSHSVSLVVMLDYATAVKDRELIEYVKRSYECFKTKGVTLTGFFPESAIPDYPSCETCEIADMIALSLELTRLGVGDYWDDADRWVRNQFAENQLTPEKCTQIAGLGHRLGLPLKHADGHYATDDHVAERNIGAFAGWASANEWFDDEMRRKQRGGIMHCCTGNAAQTVYYLWKRMLEYDGSRLRLNLLLNRASSEADVYSHIPYEGRVDLKLKKESQSVLIRMPEWVNSSADKVVCTVNLGTRNFAWEGRYVNVGPAKSGDRLTIRFPITERTLTNQKIGNGVYTLVIKGNTVVSIDPPGKQCPMYARNYRGPAAPQRALRRFLANEEITW